MGNRRNWRTVGKEVKVKTEEKGGIITLQMLDKSQEIFFIFI